MTGNARGSRPSWSALLPTLALLGLLGVLWAATLGPVDVIGPSTVRPVIHPATPSLSPSTTPAGAGDALRRLREPGTHSLAWVGDLLAWSLFIALVVLAVAGLVWLWRHRWRRPPPPQHLDAVPLPEVPDTEEVADALGGDAAHQLDLLGEGDPRNGIVACWLRLEEVVAEAGLPPKPAETSSEFIVRVLHSLDLDPRAVGSLAALYREARFSEHHLDEGARTQARALLRQLHSDLGELRGTTAGRAAR